MIDLGPATEDDVVLAFLRAEIDSARFGSIYATILANSGLDRQGVIDHPDQNSAEGGWATFTGGAPLLALFEKWPAEQPTRSTPLYTAGSRVFVLNASNWVLELPLLGCELGPQGLKPASSAGPGGTAEAVPFPQPTRSEFFPNL
jgi:hypothetical protein